VIKNVSTEVDSV